MRKLDKVKWVETAMLPVYIGFCNTEKAWNRLLKELKIKDGYGFAECGRCDYFDSASGGLTIVISMNHKAFKREPKRAAYSMLAH